MTINGFIPSAVDVNRNSLVLIVALTTHNVVSEVFKCCNNSLTSLSNKIAKDIQNLLFSLPYLDDSDVSAQKQAEDKAGNTGATNSNYIAVINLTDSNYIKRGFVDTSNKICDIFVSTLKLFQLYMNYKIALGSSELGYLLLVFMIFIFAIRQRKSAVDAALSLTLHLRKIKISAFVE
jgi:hypothetical protein